MSFIKSNTLDTINVLKKAVFVLIAVFVSACTQGVSSGSLQKKFAGVQDAKVLSPSQVRLSWLRSPEDIDYTVYMAGRAEPLKTLTFESFTVENLEPNTLYKFKVVARGPEGTLGDDKEISVSTWPRFQGLTKVTKDENGNFVLTWDYPYEVKSYHIFYLPEYAPSELNTNAWSKINAQTLENTYTVTDWKGASTYYFTVHVQYNSGEIDRPNVFQNLQANPSFPADAIEINIPTLTIGSLPVISVTPHREGVLNDYPLANYSSQLFQGDKPISDPQSGISNLVVLPNANLSLGIVEDLNVRITYNSGTINQTLIKRNRPDGTPFTTVLKNQSNILETPPVNATLGGPGFMGKVLATGDFNCDGADDLAVGMPETSIASLGQKEAYAGVVYVYYSRTAGGKTQLYTPALGAPQPAVSPAIRGVDPQIIAIADLPIKSRFGASLSAGNVNMDYANNPLHECDDLLVGSPGMQHAWSPTGVYTDAGGGSAFLFFGSSEGINAPTTLTAIAENSGTCLGNFVGDVCSAVRIWPKKENYFNSDIPQSNAIMGTYWGFGQSVSVVGDMNGDGYSEIAVGSPYSDYEGRIDDASSISASILRNAGSVHLYFGSKRGLGFAQIKKITNATTTYPLDCTSSSQKGCVKAIKIFSPLPQDGQLFGYSIAGNVDIDGNIGPQGTLYKTSQYASKCTPSRPNVCFSTSDMVVGAPGGGLVLPSGTSPFKSYSASVAPRFVGPIQFAGFNFNQVNVPDLDWPAATSSLRWNTGNFSFGTNNFAPTGNKGLAFIFFGMTGSDVQVDGGTGDRDVSTYYSCSNRYDQDVTGGPYSGGAPNDLHFSCFTNGKNVRYLHVRDAETSGLGRSVAAIGNRAAQLFGTTDGSNYTWKPLKELDATYSGASSPFNAYAGFNELPIDANGDLYGDVFVGAPYSSTLVPSKGNTGAVVGFFGNPGRLFGTDSLKAAFIANAGDVASSGYFQTAAPLCNVFDITDSTGNSGGLSDQILCRPILIKPNSLTAGGMLAHDRSALSKGDVDGDGLQDLIVGAPFDTSTGGTDSGAVFVFTSDPGRGIGTSNYKVSNVRAGIAGTRFGSSVASGRFEDPNNSFNSNGKPFVSVLAGAPNDYTGTGTVQKPGGGAVHIYKTNLSAFSGGSTPTESLKESLTSFQDLKYQSARIVGDINNDGYDDAVAHTFYYNTQGERVYEAAVYFGSRIGLIAPDFCKGNVSRVFDSGGAADDCNPKATRLATVKTKTGIKLPQKVLAPNGVINGWAFFAANVGDVNKDGFDDVLFMNPYQSVAGKGNIVLYFGSSVGLNAVNSPSYTPVSVGDPQIITGGWGYNVDQYYYISENAAFDLNLVSFGDFNGDGYNDVVLSDFYSFGPSFDAGRTWNCQAKPDDVGCPTAGVYNYGRVFVLYGSTKGLQTPRLTNGLAADLFPFSPTPGTYAGGTAFFDPYEPLPSSYPNLGSERFDEQAGISGAYACDAAYCKPTVIWNPINVFDYTKKGAVEAIYHDNLPEAFSYANISFGKSIAVGKITVGTSDDSAFDTLIVGAPDFIDLPCAQSASTAQARSGRAFLFYGSAKGIRAFSRREYYNPNPNLGGCWASPTNSGDNVIETNSDFGPGKDLMLHTRSLVADTPKRVIALQPPIPNNRVPSSFNGSGRRFGDKVQVVGDANGDGVEDLLISNRYTVTTDNNSGQIRDYGLGTFYGQGWVYYGGLCSSDNDRESWTNNDDPLAPKLSVAGTEAEFVGGLNGVPVKTLSSVCFKNNLTKKYLPHTFTVLGSSISDGDSFFSTMSSGRLGKGNFNFDGIDNYADVLVGSRDTSDSVSSTQSLGNGVVFFGSDLGLITNDLPQTFMSQKAGSTLLKPRYRPYRIKPIFKFSDARFFSGSVSTGDVNGDGAMDFMIPSDSYSGSEQNKGVNLGAFMLFY